MLTFLVEEDINKISKMLKMFTVEIFSSINSLKMRNFCHINFLNSNQELGANLNANIVSVEIKLLANNELSPKVFTRQISLVSKRKVG